MPLLSLGRREGGKTWSTWSMRRTLPRTDSLQLCDHQLEKLECRISFRLMQARSTARFRLLFGRLLRSTSSTLEDRKKKNDMHEQLCVCLSYPCFGYDTFNGYDRFAINVWPMSSAKSVPLHCTFTQTPSMP